MLPKNGKYDNDNFSIHTIQVNIYNMRRNTILNNENQNNF